MDSVDQTPFATPDIPGLPGEGWYPLLTALHRQLFAVDPGYRVEQVKEKFGVLRVYVAFSSDEARQAGQELIWQAEQASAHICERCGAPARLREDIGYMRTLCDEHAAELTPRAPYPRP